MKWSNQTPKESGWYWVKFEDTWSVPKYCTEVVYLLNGAVFRAGYEEMLEPEKEISWGDKLEIPE